MKHFYQNIPGWFNMEKQYLELLNFCNDGGTFIELGSWKGKSTSFIVTEILNSNKKINFITIDTFEGISLDSDESEKNAYSLEDKNILEQFLKNTSEIKNHFSHIVSLSHIAAEKFEDSSIDVIFIDAGHSYESVKKDLQFWIKKMKPKSIIAGHDYSDSWPGVKKAVDEFFGEPDKVENMCWFKYLNNK
jgi:predicted O-methyltransferase YrrM